MSGWWFNVVLIVYSPRNSLKPFGLSDILMNHAQQIRVKHRDP
jgi:hypothetical protein